MSLVNLEGKEVGWAPRSEMRMKNLLHRCSYVFLYHPKKRTFVVHRRTRSKLFCPGYLDLCFGGVVAYQEKYEVNALRELEEEIGIRSFLSNEEKRGMHALFKFFHEGERSRNWGKVYLAYWD